MADEELLPGRQYLLKLGTATVPAQVSALKHKIDVNTLDNHAAKTLALNEVGYAQFLAWPSRSPSIPIATIATPAASS